jgi:ABC-type oligopeptide transport system substrate-binding subunit
VRTKLMSLALATAAVLAAILTAASPASAAASYGATTSIKAFVDSNSVKNDAAFGSAISSTSGGEVVTANAGGSRPGEALLLKLSPTGTVQFQDVFNAGASLDRSSSATSVQQTPAAATSWPGALPPRPIS